MTWPFLEDFLTKTQKKFIPFDFSTGRVKFYDYLVDGFGSVRVRTSTNNNPEPKREPWLVYIATFWSVQIPKGEWMTFCFIGEDLTGTYLFMIPSYELKSTVREKGPLKALSMRTIASGQPSYWHKFIVHSVLKEKKNDPEAT